MGARPLRRAIQRYIEDPLADFVLRSELTPGGTVMVDRAPEGEDPRSRSRSCSRPRCRPPSAPGGDEADRESRSRTSGDEPETRAEVASFPADPPELLATRAPERFRR